MSSENRKVAKQKKSASARPKKAAAAPGKKKRVTIADVARRAGISPTAVSITLADRRDIVLSEATRERIKRCAEKLGYFPNRLGDGFFRGRSRLIGVLILANDYRPFLSCIAGIHEALAEADCFPLLMSTNWMDGYAQNSVAETRERSLQLLDLRRLLEYQVDGILYFSTHAAHTEACVRELADRQIPMVVLGGVEPGGGVDTVGGDNEKIGWMAAEHLLSVGCTSFAFGVPHFSHPLDDVVRSGFASRLKAAGHDSNDFVLNPDEPGDLNGLLSRLVRPPAGVFGTRDDIAALALRSAFELGWRVPRDCAVMTMGQSTLTRLNSLPISTIDRNSFAAGEEAAKLLVRRIEGFAGRPKQVLIPPSFEPRASTMSDASWLLQSQL